MSICFRISSFFPFICNYFFLYFYYNISISNITLSRFYFLINGDFFIYLLLLFFVTITLTCTDKIIILSLIIKCFCAKVTRLYSNSYHVLENIIISFFYLTILVFSVFISLLVRNACFLNCYIKTKSF